MDIRKRAVDIGEMDDQYKPFADEMHRLAKAFDEDRLLLLIEQFMEPDE